MMNDKTLSKNVNSIVFEWKQEHGGSVSNAREDGFEDAVDPLESWGSRRYERGTDEWKDYAKGFDEGKQFLEKKTGKEEMREAFIELMTFDIMHTPESEYYEVERHTPFFTETYLYALVGKDDARTVLAYLRTLMEVCGFDRREIEREIARRQNDNN